MTELLYTIGEKSYTKGQLIKLIESDNLEDGETILVEEVEEVNRDEYREMLLPCNYGECTGVLCHNYQKCYGDLRYSLFVDRKEIASFGALNDAIFYAKSFANQGECEAYVYDREKDCEVYYYYYEEK